MKKIQSVLSVFLSFIIVLATLQLTGLNAFAASSGDFEYEIYSEYEKTCVISDYTGSATSLVIPSNLDGYTVIGIRSLGGYHFDLKSVFIPETVKEMYYSNPFFYCIALEEIQLSKNNTDFCIVNDALFSKDMTELYAYPAANTNRKQFIIPENTEVIAGGAFEYSQLENISIPNTVTYIGGSAFSQCIYLKSIEIPESVTNLNGYMFHGCESLTEIVLPNTLKDIGRSVLVDTPYYNNTENWCNGLLYFGDYLMDASDSIKGEVKLMPNTKVIAEAAFLQSTEMTGIEIPNGVKYLRDDTFGNCYNLEKIVIPESVTHIDYSTFWKCDKVTVYGYADSEAEFYTEYKNIPFIALPKINIDANSMEILNARSATVENTITSLRMTLPNVSSVSVFYSDGSTITDLDTACETGMRFTVTFADGSVMTYEIPLVTPGDVNGDGKVTAMDARIALQYTAGNKTLTDEQKAAADANGDGKVTAIDARWILQAVAGNRVL